MLRSVAPRARVEEGGEPPSWRVGGYELRPLRENDEAGWYGYLRDSRVRRHTSFPEVDPETVRGMVLRTVDAARRALGCRWALVDPEAGVVGTCGFSSWSLVHAHAELVYDLSPAYWGQGLMRRSVETVLGWAFDTAGFHRVHAVVRRPMNPPSPSSSAWASSGRGCFAGTASRTASPGTS